MNLKIDKEGLRFRISSEELEDLKKGTSLQQTLTIGQKTLTIAIDPVKGNQGVSYSKDQIRLRVLEEKIHQLSDLGRSREGLEEIMNNISVFLQIDFRTRKRLKSL